VEFVASWKRQFVRGYAVFQSETFSRPEAGCGLPGILKPLKMRGLWRPCFGNRPAFNNPAVTIQVQGRVRPADAVSAEERRRWNSGYG
jgi:hypothetical protein